MPRKARIVACGIPHHVVQRGTDRQTVFFTQRDRQLYLQMLAEQSRQAHVRVLAYCLMTNHIHLVLVPEEADSLARCVQRVHGRYAQFVNTNRQRTGHLWQNRFFSCPLDDKHLWLALRYVERNPVRAGLVSRAIDYRWSSASAHLGQGDPTRMLDLDFWESHGGVKRWSQLIDAEEDGTDLRNLRRATFAGEPLGSEDFAALCRL